MPPRHVYVHVPFCARRCSYCDFSIAVRRTVPVDEYLSALAREIDIRFPRDGSWPVETLYLGGGTPSLLGASGIERLLVLLRERMAVEPGAELTIEANPDDVSLESAARWREAGVNRLSIGAQSFDLRALTWMHRTHGPEQIIAAVEAARGAGIDDLSLDLIFSLPESLGREWAADLRQAIDLRPTHVSLYGLTIESATPLGRWRDRGAVTEAPEERYEADFLAAHDALAAAGFEHYEVSNYALPGRRARHNSSYWRRVPYAGFGPSAHSFDDGRRRWNIAPYAGWLRCVEEGADPAGGEELLGKEERALEAIYLGLRTTEGLDIDRSDAERVQRWVDAGWARWRQERLVLTPAGWLRLDALAADLTVTGSRY